VLPDGATRGYLEDGDVVRMTATATGAGGVTIGFGAVEGRVMAAQPAGSPGHQHPGHHHPGHHHPGHHQGA
jgi:hypothetical protein